LDLLSGKISIIGLGYVGLPLGVEFGKHRPVLGFDVNKARISELKSGRDSTREVEPEELAQASDLSFSSDPADLHDSTIFIVTVPTPIDEANRPDLSALQKASRTIGEALKVGDVVIYESTVYPGATEEVCVPLLEAGGLRFNRLLRRLQPRAHQPGRQRAPADHHQEGDVGLHAGGRRLRRCAVRQHHRRRHAQGQQHPRGRGRQGHREHPARRQHRLINELALIFNRLGIDTEEVLEAAGSKWNFLPFRPGWSAGTASASTPII
jgi:UDP-N-acetyl-D-galactosamine dehydrogenase